jgi:flagellar biosynthesis protein FlhG
MLNFGSNASQSGGGQTRTARVLSVTSGKGGVGKTTVVSNLAMTLASQGKRVLIIDADLGLANIDIVFGLTPAFNLNHFFSGRKSLGSVITDGPENIKVLPAGSGVQQFTSLTSEEKLRFIDDLNGLHEQFDIVLVDTAAGISDNVTYFNVAAQKIVVVTTSEITAMTDAYAIMKLLATRYQEKQFCLLVNSVVEEDEALEVYRKLTLVTSRYLDISIDFLGGIPFDARLPESLQQQRAFVDMYPETSTGEAYRLIVRGLLEERTASEGKGSPQFFWNKLLSIGEGEP